MSYLGSTPASQFFAPGTDTFSGTGSQTAFTLSRNVATVNDILVVVNNVDQQPSNYTVLNNVLTFSPAPSSGTNNIYVRYLSTNLQTIAPQAGSVGKQGLDVGNSDGTGAAIMPTGTTAQRPSIPLNGMMRFNTTNAEYEVYDSGSWRALVDQATGLYTATYLVVAGGGGGGPPSGAGAGGYLSGSATILSGTTYSFVVGAGGAANNNGSNSTGLGLTAIGGGGGNGGSGGSGAGAPANGGGITAGGAGTSGQGNAGGTNGNSNAPYPSGGGGGAGAVGNNGSGNNSGNGGIGLANTITGSSVFYAGGGGGGVYQSPGVAGIGGSGGGGTGTSVGSGTGGAGTANTGGGGGGGGNSAVGGVGGAGGSGIVIISVPTVNYTGTTTGSPTVTTNGSQTVIRFTSSGSYTA